jgi:hypothetical protein
MQLLPNGKQSFFDGAGNPLANGKVYFYLPNTSTPATTYQDASGTAANPQPVALDGNGQAVIYGSGSYRQVVEDVNGVTIWDQETTAPDTNFVDLGQSGTGKGVNMVNGAAAKITSIAALRALRVPQGSDAQTVMVDGMPVPVVWNATSTATDDGVSVFMPNSLTSGQAGRWIAVQNLFVNAGMFGASPASSDNTSALQSAFDTASAAGGGVVALNAGTFICLSALRFRPGVSVIGAGVEATVIDSRAATHSVYADESIVRVEYKGFKITHVNNANTGVNMLDFQGGASRSLFNLKLSAKKGTGASPITGNGLMIRGVDPSSNTGNNNLYGNIFDLTTETLDSEITAGTALYLYGQDGYSGNAQANGNWIRSGVLDGFQTGLAFAGNGNTLGAVTFNGPCSIAAIYAYGGSTYGNEIDGAYIDAGVTGAQIKLNNTSGGVMNMLTVFSTVNSLSPSQVVDASTAPSVGTFTIHSRNQHFLGKATSQTEFRATSSIPAMLAGLDSAGAVMLAASPDNNTGRTIVSGPNFAGNTPAVSNHGGHSAVISDDPTAAHRVVQTHDGVNFTLLWELGNSGWKIPIGNSSPVNTFTMAAASSMNVTNFVVTANSLIFLQPLNAAAAALVKGHGVYVSGITAGGHFTVATQDGTAAAGTEQFAYLMIN